MTALNLAQATPPEVDGKLAELWEAAAGIRQRMEHAKFALAHTVGVKPIYETRTRRVVPVPIAELFAMAQALVAKETTSPWVKRDAEDAMLKWELLVAALASNRFEAKPLEDLYEAKQWSRFFMVQNHGGHIHRDMSCSTCYATTSYGWLPTLSGLTEKDAVEAHGPLLCSVCFPTAPVEWTTGPAKDDSDKCAGSGENVPPEAPYSRRYLECPHCHVFVSVTSAGKFRAHKKAKVVA